MQDWPLNAGYEARANLLQRLYPKLTRQRSERNMNLIHYLTGPVGVQKPTFSPALAPVALDWPPHLLEVSPDRVSSPLTDALPFSL
jgi:hypothetical protein